MLNKEILKTLLKTDKTYKKIDNKDNDAYFLAFIHNSSTKENLYKLSLVENQFKTGDYTTTFSTLIDLVYFLESELLHNLLKNSNMFDRVVIEYNGQVIVNADKIIDKLI